MKMTGVGEEKGTSKFDLTVAMTEGRDGVSGSLEYSLDLYKGETVRRMARHYERVIAEVVRDAKRRIGEIELLSDGERRQILEEWNETEREYGETRLAHEMIAAQAARSPEAVALVCGEIAVSYGELNERADRLARYLRRLGAGPEVVIGVCLERSVEMIVGLLAILKAGSAYVPLDPGYPEKRLVYMLDDSGARLLLTQRGLLALAPSRTRRK
jgi:non-ribosomal peptide synthetase component F